MKKIVNGEVVEMTAEEETEFANIQKQAQEEGKIEDEAADWAWDAVDRMSRADRQSDDAIESVVFKALRKFCKDNVGKRPLVTVSVLRV